MPGKARPGKQRTSSAAKKRLRKTSKGQVVAHKASHSHLLQQKSKRQKRLFKHMHGVNAVYNKQIKRMLPGK